MNTMTRSILALGALGSVILSPLGYASSDGNFEREHAVFVMNNDADANEVISYQRTSHGSLYASGKFKTGGRGSGGKGDPLGSQSSLTLSRDLSWLFAVNAGSGTLSVFRVEGSTLELTDRVPTGGAEPTSVAQNGSLVYVLNAAGSSSVAGFAFHEGHLLPIPSSQQFLSVNGANPGSVAFSPDGKFLLVTEKTGNDIDVFSVLPDGTLGDQGESERRPGCVRGHCRTKWSGYCVGNRVGRYDIGHLLVQHSLGRDFDVHQRERSDTGRRQLLERHHAEWTLCICLKCRLLHYLGVLHR